ADRSPDRGALSGIAADRAADRTHRRTTPGAAQRSGHDGRAGRWRLRGRRLRRRVIARGRRVLCVLSSRCRICPYPADSNEQEDGTKHLLSRILRAPAALLTVDRAKTLAVEVSGRFP